MSGSLHTWYSLRDLEALGARAAVLSGELPLARFARLVDLLHSDRGSVRATLSFRQRSGWLGFSLSYETTVELTCQRCLEPLEQVLSATVEIALVESDADGPHVPEGIEPVVAEGGRFNPAQIIEDELIVGLPLVPKHARTDDCGSLARLLPTESAAPRQAADE
jgi:uncharacterized protein